MSVIDWLKDLVSGDGEEKLTRKERNQLLYGENYDRYKYGDPATKTEYDAQERAQAEDSMSAGAKWGHFLSSGDGTVPTLNKKPLPNHIKPAAMAALPLMKREKRKRLATTLQELIGDF